MHSLSLLQNDNVQHVSLRRGALKSFYIWLIFVVPSFLGNSLGLLGTVQLLK